MKVNHRRIPSGKKQMLGTLRSSSRRTTKTTTMKHQHRGTCTTVLLLWLGVFVLLSVLCAAAVVADANEADADQATLTIDAFDTAHNFRQSFCDRYALLYNDTSYLSMLATHKNTNGSEAAEAEGAGAGDDALRTTIENVLSGTQLNLIIADDSVHFNYDEGRGINTTVPGLHADILDYIAEQSNFTWRTSFGISYYQDIQAPETFTTFLDWSNERYDMVIDYWAPTLERMQQGATFTEAYINGDMILIHNQYTPPVQKIDWWNWLKPFTTDVWYATLATIFISALIYPWMEFMGGDLDVNLFTIRKWITGRLYLSFINFTGNYAYEPKTPGGCLFGVVFAFWSMLMLASYTANLASLLVVKRIVPPPVINVLQDAIDHSMTMCYPQGTFAADYLAERYPPNVLSEMFIPVPDTAADKYGALNNGTCDFLIDWRNSYDIVKHQQDYNPGCQLIQEGRTIQTLEFTFATMLDPAQKCTLLLKEVFNYYLKQMKENGKLEELWQDHISSQSDPGHCDSTYGDNTRRNAIPTTTNGGENDADEDGTEEEDEDAATRRLRSLKGGGKRAATAGSVLSLDEENVDSEEMSLTIMDMGGIFLLQVIGALVAILFTVLSYLENKYLRDKKAVPVKRVCENMRQAQLLEQHQHHPPTTHSMKDDTVDVDDAKYGYDHGSISRPRNLNYSNRETTLSTRDGSSLQSVTSDSSTTHHLFLNNSDDNGTDDDVHDDDDDDDDDDECSRQDSSTRLPRRPSFNSKKKNNNDDKDWEREQEHRSRQREHQSLDHVQQRLHHLQSSHEELKQHYDGLKQQNETIISLLANMTTVVSQNKNSLDYSSST